MLVRHNNNLYRIDSPILDRLSYVYANSIAFDESVGAEPREVEVDLSFLPQDEVETAVDYLEHPSIPAYENLNDEIIGLLGINEPTRDIILYDDFIKMENDHKIVWDITPDIYEVCLNLVQYVVSFGYDSIIYSKNDILSDHIKVLLSGSKILWNEPIKNPIYLVYGDINFELLDYESTNGQNFYAIGGNYDGIAVEKIPTTQTIELSGNMRLHMYIRNGLYNPPQIINVLGINPIVNITVSGLAKFPPVPTDGLFYDLLNSMHGIEHTRKSYINRRIAFMNGIKVPMLYINFGDILNKNIIINPDEFRGRKQLIHPIIYDDDMFTNGILRHDVPIIIHATSLQDVQLQEYYRTNPIFVYIMRIA